MDGQLVKGWEALYGAIQAAVGQQFWTALGAIGVGLIAWSIVQWLRKRISTGSWQGGKELIIPLVLGSLLAATAWAMPIILTGVEWFINLLGGIFDYFFG